jgi:hypothetical protein
MMALSEIVPEKGAPDAAALGKLSGDAAIASTIGVAIDIALSGGLSKIARSEKLFSSAVSGGAAETRAVPEAFRNTLLCGE